MGIAPGRAMDGSGHREPFQSKDEVDEKDLPDLLCLNRCKRHNLDLGLLVVAETAMDAASSDGEDAKLSIWLRLRVSV